MRRTLLILGILGAACQPEGETLPIALREVEEAASDSSSADAFVPDDVPESDVATEDVPAEDVATEDVPFHVENPRNLLGFVDPRIGTGGSGNVAIGAAVPHGWIRAGPETEGEPLAIAAYRYGDTAIRGFTHTNLSGPGGSAYGYSQVRFNPRVGPLETHPELLVEPFSHDTEVASPGYYAVTLAESGVRVELTASGHSARHRYTFPAQGAAHLLVDLGSSLGQSIGGAAAIVDSRTIEGYGVYQVHPAVALLVGEAEPTGHQTVYMTARFSRDFVEAGAYHTDDAVVFGVDHTDGTGSAAFASFATEAGDVIEVAVGLSLIDIRTARANLEVEIGERSFDTVRKEAEGAWNDRLNRIQVEGTDTDKTIFYSSLYHVMLQPVDYTEARPAEGAHSVSPAERYYTAFDGVGAVFEAEGRRYYADDWCAWDTYRTAHPLRTLFEPEIVGDIVQSYVHGYEQGGWLEQCPWSADGYSRVMIANPSFPIIADALTKGLSDFDHDAAFAAMMKGATDDNPNQLENGGCGYLNLGTVPFYRENGWVHDECDKTQAASMTLEYAYDDWCLARVAEVLGHTAERDTFENRSGNWKNQFNAATGFMQSRKADGTWREPFDPSDASTTSGFCESTSWTYTFHVPHDVAGLVALVGGAAEFVAKLDEFFDGHHFDIGNEPGFHIPWLYTLAGAAHRTQERVLALLDQHFSTAPDGLPGNDDSGAMSAWAAFAQLGLYPVTPGDGRYVLSTPVFTKATFALHPDHTAGGTFTIETEGSGPGAVYIQKATLNGTLLTRSFVTHAEISAGGTLVLTLGSTPPPSPAD